MVSPFSHLETGMLKSPSLSDCIIVEGKGDNECESCGKYKFFEPVEAIVIICMLLLSHFSRVRLCATP